MARKAGLWWRTAEECWYTTHKGKPYRLDPDKSRAEIKFHRLKGGVALTGQEEEFSPTLAHARALYEQHLKEDCVPDSHKRRLQRLDDFIGMVGSDTKIAALRRHHLTDWFRKHPRWGPATRRLAQQIVQAACGYLVKEGHIATHPLQRLESPKAPRRLQVVSGKELTRIIAAMDDQGHKKFVEFLRDTGCRPFSEAAKLTAAHWHAPMGYFELKEWKNSRKTGKPRRIYVSPDFKPIISALCALYPDGPIFRSGRTGNPTAQRPLQRALRRACKAAKLPEIIPYTIRHSYITEMLVRGQPVEIVAELVGSSPQTIHAVYAHLDKRPEALQAAAAVAALR